LEVGVSLSDVWVGLAGALGGVVVGGLMTLLVEWVRWRREDRKRLFERRVAAYADLITKVQRVSRLLDLDGDGRREGLLAFFDAVYVVDCIASPAVKRAADDFMVKINGDGQGPTIGGAGFERAIAEFTAAVREDVGANEL
jgi:hypothetical protein